MATVYLRLKIVDKDGKVAYSKVVKISENKSSAITISPNPAKEVLNITVSSNVLNNTKAELVNAQGKVVKSFALYQGILRIDIANLSTGLYCLRTSEGSRKVIINNN
jgi:hypothetical protein